jgi:hypothetical protein
MRERSRNYINLYLLKANNAPLNGMFRGLASFLVLILIFSPLSPVSVYAQEASTTTTTTATTTIMTALEQRLADRESDTTAPSINAQSDVSVQATSEAGAVVSYTPPATFDDVDGAGIASCTPPPDSTFVLGTTVVTCTATDVAGNATTPTTFKVIVVAPTPTQAATSTAATTPIAVETSTATTTPITVDTGTSTPATAPIDTGSASSTTPVNTTNATSTPIVQDPSSVSQSVASSAELDPSETDTDNTDFSNITNGAPPPGPNDPRPKIDASATSTEALSFEPQFTFATSTDGTGSKIGGTIFTGSAVASTTVKNILNITRSNVDGPGATNSSIITAATDNTAFLSTKADANAFSGDNLGQGGVGDATIRSGKAVASAEVINVVNTNLFNSKGLVLFLNPYNGDSLDLRDIDLSYFTIGGSGASPTQLGCTILTCLNSSALSILNKNEATVDNNVYVRASTGGNSATSTKNGAVDITTGNAYATANVLNLVNTNFINSKYLVLSYNNFGDLNDDIILPEASFFRNLFSAGASLPELNSSSYVVNNTNDENFTGTTTASAITGENIATTTAIGQGHGEIFTGKAFTSSTNYTSANQTRVGGASVLLVFRVSGNWTGTVNGLPSGMTWQRTAYGVEIMSVGVSGSGAGGSGAYNSSAFVASSTNKATVNTDVKALAETGQNSALTEDATSTIKTGDAYATANVVNLVNTNIVNRSMIFATFNIFGDWSGDINFGGFSPDMKVTTTIDAPNPIAPGSSLTYHFMVKNNGDVDADNVILRAKYDKNLLFISRSSAVSTDVGTGTEWNLGRIAVGASMEVVATARVFAPGLPAGFSMTLPLTAVVSSSMRDQDDSDNTQIISVVVSSPPASSASGGGSSGGSTDPRDRSGTSVGSSGTTTPPPSGGGGGGGSPPPSSGGGGAPPPSGGGNSGGSSAPNNNSSPAASNNAGNLGSSSGGGGAPSGSALSPTSEPNPQITVVKTSSIGTTTAPAIVDYKVIVTNAKSAGAAYYGILTDTLYDPQGAPMNNRSWDLETIVPGDQITLTYSVEYSTSTVPGIYHNVARVTGKKNHSGALGVAMIPIEASKDVIISSNGLVLGVATTSPKFAASNIAVTPEFCIPLLTSFMAWGSSNEKSQVVKLQAFLNTEGARLPTTGYFGPMTTAAVKSFQIKYKSEILTPLGLLRPTGNVYGSTQRKINQLNCDLPSQAGGADPVEIVGPASNPTVKPKVSAQPASPKPKASQKSKVLAKPIANAKPLYESSGGLFEAVGSFFSKFRP